MRKLGLLLAAMLLIALLPQPAKAAEQGVYIVQRKQINRDWEGTFSASRSGYIELGGGWGASVEYGVAPAAGAPVWRAGPSARGQVNVSSATFSLVVKVFYVSLSSGLGSWTTVEQRSGSTYMDEPVTFNGRRGRGPTRCTPVTASRCRAAATTR